jgi:hypothetical protein
MPQIKIRTVLVTKNAIETRTVLMLRNATHYADSSASNKVDVAEVFNSSFSHKISINNSPVQSDIHFKFYRKRNRKIIPCYVAQILDQYRRGKDISSVLALTV